MDKVIVNADERKQWEQRLAKIFIRVKNSEGGWDNINCLDATSEQFDVWFKDYIAAHITYDDDSLIDKAGKISLLDDMNISPVEYTGK